MLPTAQPPAFTGGGCATLTDMYNAQSGSGPLYVLDSSDKVVSGSPTGRWLLTSSLEILDGVTLYVHGTSAGGDADVLRIEVCVCVCVYTYKFMEGWDRS